MLENLLILVLGGGNLLLFIQYLIDRHDKKKEKEDFDIKSEIRKIKKDCLRTQLLLMIFFRPEEKKEILTLGEEYFKVLHGNWYTTSIFNTWLEASGEARPEWFKAE